MSGVFSDLKPKNRANRNGFDLSRRSVFSLKTGQIVPCFVQATLPDSEYSIDVRQLLRTQPLQTAAFTGFSVNYDFFFVPNNYSYSSFNEFISQRQDERHVGQPRHTLVPTFSLYGFVSELVLIAAWDTILAEHFEPSPVGYYLRDEEPLPDKACFLIGSANLPWASVALEVVRALDMYGYGNFLPLVNSLAAQIYRFFIHQIDPLTPTSYEDWKDAIVTFNSQVWPEEPIHSVGQLVHLLHYIVNNEQSLPNYVNIDSWLRNVYKKLPIAMPSLWPALAYNKAFYEYYRSEYYDENFNIRLNDFERQESYVEDLNFRYVELFNFDDWTSEYNEDSAYNLYSYSTRSNFARICAIFMLKNHLYKKDLFTGTLPSTQFGDVSMMVTTEDWSKLMVRNDSTVNIEPDYSLAIQNYVRPLVSTPVGISNGEAAQNASFRFDPALAISVLESRRADAMQRFKERLMRAGNKVKDVFQAHGWSKPYSASEAEPIFLGTFDGRLDINTVAATSPADGVELAQLGANGTAVVQGSKIHFKCHDFGYIVGVVYVVKDAEYDAYGLEKQFCMVEPFDYPYPELQNISLFPVDTIEISGYLRGWSNENVNLRTDVGYLPRDMQFKTAVDKVHGEFFTAPIYPLDRGHDNFTYGGVFSDWVTPRKDVNNPTSVSFLYQSPMCADNIFLQAANALQSSDHFLINCMFDCKAVEPLSVIGLPY